MNILSLVDILVNDIVKKSLEKKTKIIHCIQYVNIKLLTQILVSQKVRMNFFCGEKSTEQR